MTDFLRLKRSNCKNCYKCIRYCPVKSIKFSGNQAHIVSDECILCGQCFVVCPQNAKEISDETEKAKVLIQTGEKVFASIAPSFVANYDGVGIAAMEVALKKLGFYAVEETAVGATMVKRQYERIISDKQLDIVISSCCQSVNLLIQKHYPEVLKYLAPVVSPMHAHSMNIKKRHPDAKTIFIGPCLSKKDEAERSDNIVDCVLTFEDLSKWLYSEGIAFENIPDSNNMGKTRFFPTAGGIIKTMTCDSTDYNYLSVDGLDNCINAINDIASGGLTNYFIEMSACNGSCIGGPVMEKYHHSPLRNYKIVSQYAGHNDFKIDNPSTEDMFQSRIYIGNKKRMPGSRDIEIILNQMGKTKSEEELNCGSCGYSTCKDKAIAVYQGKADLTMCLPFLKDKAESFSDNIVNNTPNGIIVLNEDLEVQQINESALKMMNIRSSLDVLGEHVVCILNPNDFIEVLESQKNMKKKRVYLAEYKKYFDQTVIFDKNYRIFICITSDVTNEEIEKDIRKKIRRTTIETTDKVIEKQMRVVQEIAFLLGETTAETKIALTKLKESLKDE